MSGDLISGNAPLPAVYESAKTALANCAKIDECKDWADKAIALASYARQANDESLLKASNRIKARAVHRMGKLFEQIESSRGHNLPNVDGGGDPTIGKQQAARDAGVSQDQRRQAQRVASIADDEFETLIESDDPPTITALAELNQRGASNPGAMKASTDLLGSLKRLALFCDAHQVDEISGVLAEHEKTNLVTHARTTVQWLTKLMETI